MSSPPIPHMTTICQVRFPKLENRPINVFRKFIPFLTSLYFRAAARKKRLPPQHLVCDKSLKRTHGIGHFCRDDAAIQHPVGPTECPLLPFIESIKPDFHEAVNSVRCFFSKPYLSVQTSCSAWSPSSCRGQGTRRRRARSTPAGPRWRPAANATARCRRSAQAWPEPTR